MKDADIRKYAQLMGELGLTGLEIREQDSVVRLERSYGAAAPAPAAPVSAPAEPPRTPAADTVSVCSPMVGVFYVAPSPGAEPFVHVGSKVKKGETLCILEAMKLMNEVVAECDGEIAEICANDGDLVEYGRVLFRIY